MKEKLLVFYAKNKKVVWIVGVVLVLILGFSIFGGEKGDKWEDIILSEKIPKTKKGKLDITTNETDNAFIGVEDVDDKYYAEYKDECVKMGYTIDAKEDGDEYEAFNKDGYKLRVYIIFTKMYIDLNAPEKLGSITWPTSGIGLLLPTPKSTLGRVESDSSDYFRIILGDTSKDEYNNYVKSCEDKGFNVDYDKRDDYYSAKNSDGYSIVVSYLGNNNIEVKIELDDDNSSSGSSSGTVTDTPSTNESSNSGSSENLVDGMHKEFKDAMDSYEKFMDEYVAFMKKYKNSNGTDLSLLGDYADYVSKYSEFVENFDKWDSEDLNTKEAAYYLEVQSRVTKKLLEVAN